MAPSKNCLMHASLNSIFFQENCAISPNLKTSPPVWRGKNMLDLIGLREARRNEWFSFKILFLNYRGHPDFKQQKSVYESIYFVPPYTNFPSLKFFVLILNPSHTFKKVLVMGLFYLTLFRNIQKYHQWYLCSTNSII